MLFTTASNDDNRKYRDLAHLCCANNSRAYYPFYVPANQAITPTIVLKEQLQTANAYIDGMVRLMMFLAPILGGVMIEFVGVKLTLFLVCLFLFISGGLLLFVQEKSTKNGS